MITRVRLKNWKSHLDSEFDFAPGVNALMGIMGSGKSSVMQAISFALFGTFPSHQSKKVSLDDLIMAKPQKQTKAEVELEFRLGEDNYYVKRVLEQGKGTTHAEIRKNQQLLDVNPQGVTSEVERALQMDYELFSKAVYSEQDGIDYFLRLPKGQRMVQIDRMVRLDRFGQARERCVSLRNRVVERRKEKLRFVMEFEKEDFAGRLGGLEEELEGLEQQVRFSREGLRKAGEEKASIERGVGAYEEKEGELNSLRVGLGSVSAGMQEVEEQARNRKAKTVGKSAEQVSQRLEKLNGEISVLEEQAEAHAESEKVLRETVSGFNARIMLLEREEVPKLRESLNEMEEHNERLAELGKKLGREPEKLLAARTQELDEARAALCGHEAARTEVLSGLSQLKAAGARCPVCDCELAGHRKEELLAHKNKTMDLLDKEIAQAKERCSALAAAVEDVGGWVREAALLRERVRDYGKQRTGLEAAEKSVENFRKEAARTVASVQKLKEERARAEARLAENGKERSDLQVVMNNFTDIAELQKRLEDYTGRRKELEVQVGRREEELRKVNIKELRALLQKAVALESETAARLASMEERIAERRVVMEDIRRRKAVMEGYQQELRRDEALAAQLESFAKALKVTQEQLREEFLKSVNTVMNRVWDELYPYGDFSEVRMMIEDGDYVLKLRGSEGWVSADGMASGGERSMAVLALRIAFSLAFIPNLRWLILDEPTHNLDANAIEHFSTVLRDKMDGFAEQVFLITHEDGLAGGITGRLYNLERDKAANQATRIRENAD